MRTAEGDDFALAHSYHGIAWSKAVASRGTILDAIAASAHHDAPYLTVSSVDGATSATLSYRQLDEHSGRIAAWLRQEHGAGPGSIVALLPANDLPSALAIFAGLRAGCTLFFLNPNDPPARLRQQVDHQRASLVVRSADVSADSLPEAITLPDPEMLARPSRTLDAVIDPASTAMLFGTSGSTATSKLVEQSHTALVVNAEAVRRHHRLQPGDRVLGCLPLHHVNGVHFTLLAPLVAGAHATLARGFDPFGYPRLLARVRPRLASVAPSLLEALVRTWRDPALPPDFAYFVSAAAPLLQSTARTIARVLRTNVRQGYGLTETVNFSTTVPADVTDEVYRRMLLDADIPSIGVAMDGNEVAILRPDGSRAEPGETGEVCMRGHNIMTGYAGNDTATAMAFRGGWFHSEDLGFVRRDETRGRDFIVLTGRIKNIAKVGGEAVSLDEVERGLRAISGVRDAACVAVPHPMLGDEVIAAVVLATGSAVDLRRHLAAWFSPNALPRRIVTLDAIPRTATGKILRAQLAEQLTANEHAQRSS